MSFDETYDEVLRAEFSSREKQAAPGIGLVLQEEIRPQGTLVATVDAPIQAESVLSAPPALVEDVTAEGEGPRGLARYRTAAMGGAGGLACAAVGAFLGGLGGHFTVNPASARSLAAASSPDQSPAAALKQAHDASFTVRGSAARGTASLISLSGTLTQGIAPLQWLTAGIGTMPVTSVRGTLADLPGVGPSGTGTGSGSGSGIGAGLGSGCTGTPSDPGLGCILDSLTAALGNVGALSNPTGSPGGPVPALGGVLTDVSGMSGNLSFRMPISSLPLPSGGISTAGLPGLGSLGPGLPPGSGSGGTSPSSAVGGPTSLVNGVNAADAGAIGGSSPSLPSLPLPSGGGPVPSLPVPKSGGGTAAPPTVTTTTNPASGGTTTMTVPLPA
ncbi:MAG TPA: hypothetical protein VGF41_00255, partial [Myxococcaceae bacterium]